MTTEQAIRNHWAAYAPLTNLVPTSRLYLDEWPTQSPTMPYVVMTMEGEAKDSFSSHEQHYLEIHRFNVWSDVFATGNTIRDLIRERFNRQQFTADRNVMLFQYSGSTRLKEENGVWRWTIDFNALLNEAA